MVGRSEKIRTKKKTLQVTSSVTDPNPDPDPSDPFFLGLLDPDS